MSRYLTWLRKYNGKPVTVDLEERARQDEDFEFIAWSDRSSFGVVDTNLRPYRKDDDRQVLTGLKFHVDANGKLCDIAITAAGLGDDGLGGVDPEDVWCMSDYRCAKEFLESITS